LLRSPAFSKFRMGPEGDVARDEDLPTAAVAAEDALEDPVWCLLLSPSTTSGLKALNSTESEEDAKLKLELEGRTQGADAGMVIAGDFFKSCGNGGREEEELPDEKGALVAESGAP